MALPECVGKRKSLLGTGAALVLCFIVITGCGVESDGRNEGIGASTAARESIAAQLESMRTGSPQAEEELPLIDREAVVGALPWIVDTLALEKHYRKDDFQIDSYEISPDKRYAIVNISNGVLSGTSGPFYRFLVFNPKAKRIFYPSMSILRSDNLGYPYNAAKFNDRNQVAIAYGYRSITASTVALPDGKILTNRELDVFDSKEIEKALARMLEQAR